MEKKARFSIIGLAVVLLISLGLILQLNNTKQSLELSISKLNTEKTSLNKQIEDLSLEKQNYEDKINSLNEQIKKITGERQDLQKKFDGLTIELAKKKEENSHLKESLESGQEEFQERIKELKKDKETVEREILYAQKKTGDLETKVNDLDKVLRDKNSEIENIKKELEAKKKELESEKQRTVINPSQQPLQKDGSVELPPIIVRSAPNVLPNPVSQTPVLQPPVSLPFTGKIVAVNRDNNFVVVDLGQGSGIKINDSLRVYRNNKEIAVIKVIQVRDSVSACDIVNENIPTKTGDLVRQ